MNYNLVFVKTVQGRSGKQNIYKHFRNRNHTFQNSDQKRD